MKTSELIQYVAKDLLDDRKALVSGESDVLFSAALIARYLADGEQLLARRAWVITDAGATLATRIQLVENKMDYPLHKSVLFVKAIRLSDSDIDLVRVGYDDNRARSAWLGGAKDYWDVNSAYVENPGRPSRFSTDMGTRIVRVRQKPDAAAALLKLHLVAVRMPITPISHELPDNVPESPEEYHMLLAKYAAGKCLQRPSVEAELRSFGRELVREFEAGVLEAKRDRQRLEQSEPQHRFGGWAQAD